jgi:hypothetical protein
MVFNNLKNSKKKGQWRGMLTFSWLPAQTSVIKLILARNGIPFRVRRFCLNIFLLQSGKNTLFFA